MYFALLDKLFSSFPLYVIWTIGVFLVFRLYLFTEIDNPHFLPSVYNFVTMVNFTVTFQGLQDQLLSTVVSHEVPHLEKQHSQLLEQIALDAIMLEELEEKTLDLLQNSQGKWRCLVILRDFVKIRIKSSQDLILNWGQKNHIFIFTR